ncbi:hypothetical protein P3W45_000205 [Vairimorpha bombi]
MYLGRGQNIRKNHTHLFRKNIKDLIESIDCTVESESKEQEKEKIISNEVSENGEGLDPRWLVDPRDEPVWHK